MIDCRLLSVLWGSTKGVVDGSKTRRPCRTDIKPRDLRVTVVSLEFFATLSDKIMDCRRGDGGGGNQLFFLGDERCRDRIILRRVEDQSDLVGIKLELLKPFPTANLELR